ncbi:MAG TPA: septal ring lytic transglycosylase RlpA family protein [Candidatus Kryptobacter bacterium]|nr:septal ring lytic transglycosylase RlpA family protein [Candidatus Kryptobacter bacterium]
MKRLYLLALLTVPFYLFGCSSAERFTGSGPSPTGPATSQGSSPTRFSGKVLLTIEGAASYYSYGFNGKKTASGEIFDKNAYTAAHREFPFGTLLRVTNLDNNKSVEVKVNDRGPFAKGRIIDLSEAAARAIGMIQTGTADVKIEVLKWGKSQEQNGN